MPRDSSVVKPKFHCPKPTTHGSTLMTRILYFSWYTTFLQIPQGLTNSKTLISASQMLTYPLF